MWIVPASRMKAGREHRVPLSPAAVAVLRQMQAIRQSRFCLSWSRRRAAGINALHGLLKTWGAVRRLRCTAFRSTFRDWAAERTSFPRELAELALSHSVGSDVEQAYRRSDMFDKRRKLMDAWAEFCGKPAVGGKVVAIRGVS